MLGCEDLLFGINLPTLWVNLLPPSLGQSIEADWCEINVFASLTFIYNDSKVL